MAKPIADYNTRLDDLENEITEVTALLRDNVEKVIERGEKIEKLQSRSQDLESSSIGFRTSAVKLRKKYWWKNCKMGFILGLAVVIILTIIIVVVVELKPWEAIDGIKHNGTGIQTNRKPVVILWPRLDSTQDKSQDN